ncbi:unnamed protein product [Lactuca saligna]|uniref:Non-haem dioxygenase N-terminal domain-containing protein n=1 Tax=Lactuca saligna TaxID=75948 RepID=A0AA35ZAI4_LACSI|nr:unnamed protein product [Lactuca saligna]
MHAFSSMDVLTSNWSNIQSLPESYVFPPERRPGTNNIPASKDIPIIDLEKIYGPERYEIVQHIIKASQDFGLFQVINHGVSRDLMYQTMRIFQDFFASPAEFKSRFYSNDLNSSCRLYTSTLNYKNETVHYWRDNLTHRCHPLEDHITHWPEYPSGYRNIIGKYSIEARKFLLTMLELICEGMGLEMGYFGGELSKIQLISVNHHIPCPNPSLTLGMPEHCDPNLISMLQQGLQLRVISNEKLASAVHRVVTNSKESRTTIGTFLTPSSDILIRPADSVLKESSLTPLYRGYTYKEFFSMFTGNNCDAERALECFKL